MYRFMNKCFQIYLSRNPEEGSLGHMVALFLIFLRTLHTVFHRGCTNLYSHQQYTKCPFSQHSLQYLLYLVLLIVAVLTGVRWNLTGVLIHSSLIATEVEHLFMLSICWPFGCLLGKVCVQVLCPFFNEMVWFLFLSCMSSSLYFGYQPPVRGIVCKYLLPLGFILLMIYFAAQKHSSFVFAFTSLTFGVKFTKIPLRLGSVSLVPIFSSVYCIIFRTYIQVFKPF